MYALLARYGDYAGGYGGGYGNLGYSGAGNFQLGAKRKSDLGDFGGSPKKAFGSPRGNATIWYCVNPVSVDSITCNQTGVSLAHNRITMFSY